MSKRHRERHGGGFPGFAPPKVDPVKARAELGGDCLGAIMGLGSVPDPLVAKLWELVPERGSDLWVRFTKWRDAQPDQGGEAPFSKWVGDLMLLSMFGGGLRPEKV